MGDFLSGLVKDAQEAVVSGCYNSGPTLAHEPLSLSMAITSCSYNAVIAEMKRASPAYGVLNPNLDPSETARAIERGGAVGLSVLTERKNFLGSLENLVKARKNAQLPVLMKDIVVDRAQIEAARKLGADAILLIASVFGQEEVKLRHEEAIDAAQRLGLEVLLEVHDEREFAEAMETDADIIGINNRDLRTLKVDLDTTIRIMKEFDDPGKTVVSESGIETANHIRTLKKSGVDGFLIGSAIMKSRDLEKTLKELVFAR